MIFNRKKKHLKLIHESHLKNLMVLAMADGELSEIEEHLLEAIAHRLGLSEIDISNIKEDLDRVHFVLPNSYDDRIEQFNDLLTLMSVDGHIDPSEVDICKEFARKYELMQSVYEDLINKHI